MEKKGVSRSFVVGLVIVLVIIFSVVLGVLLFVLFSGGDYEDVYEERIASGEIVNPVEGLTDEEAVLKFDESFVYYLLVNIKAYNLREPVFSSDTPKMEIYVGEDVFNAEILEGEIDVGKGGVGEEDVIIRTSKEEAVKMIRDKDYIEESFEAGKSSIELVAEETTLFSKGYLKIYTELTGKSLTGDAIKTFFS